MGVKVKSASEQILNRYQNDNIHAEYPHTDNRSNKIKWICHSDYTVHIQQH